MMHLGDYVEANGETGRVHKVHLEGCPESPHWLSIQQLLGDDPIQYANHRWISFLCHGGGAVTVPDIDKFVKRIEPFKVENPWIEVYFGS